MNKIKNIILVGLMAATLPSVSFAGSSIIEGSKNNLKGSIAGIAASVTGLKGSAIGSVTVLKGSGTLAVKTVKGSLAILDVAVQDGLAASQTVAGGSVLIVDATKELVVGSVKYVGDTAVVTFKASETVAFKASEVAEEVGTASLNAVDGSVQFTIQMGKDFGQLAQELLRTGEQVIVRVLKVGGKVIGYTLEVPSILLKGSGELVHAVGHSAHDGFAIIGVVLNELGDAITYKPSKN